MGTTASLVDYQVLHDVKFTLDANTNNLERTLHFELPSDLVLSDGGRQPILAFNIRSFQSSTMKVWINDREVMQVSYGKGKTRGTWESFRFGAAFPEGSSAPNQVPVRMRLSRGKVDLSDVVLWYQIKR